VPLQRGLPLSENKMSAREISGVRTSTACRCDPWLRRHLLQKPRCRKRPFSLFLGSGWWGVQRGCEMLRHRRGERGRAVAGQPLERTLAPVLQAGTLPHLCAVLAHHGAKGGRQSQFCWATGSCPIPHLAWVPGITQPRTPIPHKARREVTCLGGTGARGRVLRGSGGDGCGFGRCQHQPDGR